MATSEAETRTLPVANADDTSGDRCENLKIAAAAGLFAASFAGAAFAQDASGATAPATPGAAMSDPSQPAMTSPSAPSSSMPTAPSAETSASNSNATATVDQTTVTNGPVPDTAANRAKYGSPMSHAGKKTKPAGN